jgi:hypothetical protein
MVLVDLLLNMMVIRYTIDTVLFGFRCTTAARSCWLVIVYNVALAVFKTEFVVGANVRRMTNLLL